VIKRALLSTFDKTGLAEFAGGLADLGVELVTLVPTGDEPVAWTTDLVENVVPRLADL